MRIHTMAMQISEKNWSVAAAILGSEITSKPMGDSYGDYVVINTFERGGYVTYSSPRAARDFGADLTLYNTVLSAEDFQIMFDYDKRTKNLESFFEVTQINRRPLKIHPDQELGEAIDRVNQLWHQED